jgi:hypothetical protein
VDLSGSNDQRAKHHCSGARIVERRMGWGHVEGELLDEPGQARGLAFGQLQHQPGQCSGVDDRMLQRAFEPPPHQPGVKRVVTVLHQNCALGEPKKSPASVAELRSSDQHRTIYVVPLFGVGIDRGPGVDEGVEEGERARERESLSAELQHEERSVPCRLDVDGDELGIVKQRLRAKLGRIDGDLFPGDRLSCPAGLEIDGFHDGRLSSADRMNCISSRVIALRRTTAAA